MTTCESIEKFPVVMLYDHLSSVSAAMTTFTHLTQELEAEFAPELRVWRMDDAASPEFIQEANADISSAEVILLSVRGNEPWPKAFQHWADGSEGLPGESMAAPQAVVAVIEADEDGTPSSVKNWNDLLGSGATQIHPEVFVCETKAKESAEEDDADEQISFGAAGVNLADIQSN
jgi:hypothetical protein